MDLIYSIPYWARRAWAIFFIIVWMWNSFRVAFDSDWLKRKISTFQGRAFDNYREGLEHGLRWLSRFIGDDATGRPPAWSLQSYFFCLDIATVYPIFFMIVAWAMFNGTGHFSGMSLLPEDLLERERATLFIVPLVATATIMAPFVKLSQPANFARPLLVVLLVDMFIVFRVAAIGTENGMLATCIFFGLLSTSVGMRGVPVWGGVFIGTTAAAFAVASQSVLGNALVPLLLIFVAWIANQVTARSLRRRSLGWPPVLLFTLMALAPALSLATLDGQGFDLQYEVWAQDDVGVSASPVVFLMLLPALNAPLDWFALGLTRRVVGLIAGSSEGDLAFLEGRVGRVVETLLIFTNTGVTIALALLIVFGTVAGVALFDRLDVLAGGAHLYNVEQIIRAVAANPADKRYWWIYAMMGWTLVPTLIHSASFVGALIASSTRSLGGSVLARPLASRNTVLRLSVGPLGLAIYYAIIVPVFVIVPVVAIDATGTGLIDILGIPPGSVPTFGDVIRAVGTWLATGSLWIAHGVEVATWTDIRGPASALVVISVAFAIFSLAGRIKRVLAPP
jgi:hypothetical protein